MESIIEVRDSNEDYNIITRTPTIGEELELVNDFIRFKKETFYNKDDDKNLAVFVETKINNRYPDVVFIEYSLNKIEKLNELISKPLTQQSLRLYNFISYNSEIDNDELYLKFNLTWKNLLKSLTELYDNNLLARENHKWKTINENYFKLFEIEAFEAKVSNNKDLIKQAVLNKLFSTKSFTLTPLKTKPHKTTIDRYKSLGLGYYIQKEEKFECINDAVKSVPLTYNCLQYAEWIRMMLV